MFQSFVFHPALLFLIASYCLSCISPLLRHIETNNTMLMQNVGIVTHETEERTISGEQGDESQGRIIDELVFRYLK